MPVALNLYVIRKQADAAGDFFRSVQKQRPNQYQGLYLVSAEGKVLASHQKFQSEKTWANELMNDLRPGLQSLGAVSRRRSTRTDPLPHRGLGVKSNGSATLAVYLRTSIKGIPLREVPNPTIDSIELSRDELTQLAPQAIKTDNAWVIPEKLARKFCKLLGPADESSMPRPNEVSAVKLTGRIVGYGQGVTHIAYQGRLTGAHKTHSGGSTQADATMTGIGTVDSTAGELRSLAWVFEGTYRAPPPYDQPKIYSGVVEWSRSSR